MSNEGQKIEDRYRSIDVCSSAPCMRSATSTLSHHSMKQEIVILVLGNTIKILFLLKKHFYHFFIPDTA